jgi:hypothetical protein
MRYWRYCPRLLKEFLFFVGLKILFRGQELLGGDKFSTLSRRKAKN